MNDLNKRFSMLVGVEPEIVEASDTITEEVYPDYAADPRRVLMEMDRIGKLRDFLAFLYPTMHLDGVIAWLKKYILDESGLLVREAIWFLTVKGKYCIF